MFGAHPMFRIGGGQGYQITNSLRFRASNSAYIRRTIGASSTSTTVATWSFWIKRGAFAAARQVIVYNGNTAGTGNTIQLEFTSGSAILAYFNGAGTTGFTTNAVFRDPSAWYHVVLAYDSTQATDSNRAKLYVNGTQITSFSSVTYPALNQAFNAGSGDYQQMMGFGATLNTDGYMAHVYFIDGQALTPSSFGQTDATTGVWVPKAYSGTYGTNGFFLEFKDAASTTTIGYDTSGNSNNFTTSGISVTAGTTFDQMTDTPTNNYSTMNPIASHTSVGTFAAANMQWSYGAGAYYAIIVGSAAINSKSYWEVTVTSVGGAAYIGIILASQQIKGTEGTNNTLSSAGCWSYDNTGKKNNNNAPGSGTAYGSTYTTGDVIGVTYDPSTTTLTFYKNNVSQGSAYTNVTSGDVYAFVSGISGADFAVNFGQRPFAYTPPSGFKALSTANITSTAVSTSGTFTGNAAADGPFVWTNGNPATLLINGNGVTFGTDADKTAGGFKLRTASASYNASGSNTWTATAGKRLVQSRKPNNAQVNP